MAQRVIGLDIGSQHVRVAVFDASFRKFELLELVERSVGRLGLAPWTEEWTTSLVRVLSDLKRAGTLVGETLVTSLPGDKLSSRIMSLPFTDTKQIANTLGFELENFLPYGVEDIVYDHIVLEKREAVTKLMAFAVERQSFNSTLDALREAGIDPRFVGVGAMSFIQLLKHLPALPEDGPIAVVDIGAYHTDIAVFNKGLPEIVRTVLRGSHHVTEALASELQTELERAEQVKLEEGLVSASHDLLKDERQRQIATAARSAIDPLIQRIHMTLQARLQHVDGASEVRRIYVCGGGAKLRNLYDYIEHALEIPTEPLALGSLEWNRLSGPLRDESAAAKAIACGVRGTTGGVREDINFRRGSFAFKGDFNYLQGKLAYLGGLVLVLLATAGFKAWLKSQQLDQQLQGQYAALESFSKEVLGKPMEDFSAVLEQLNKVPDAESMGVFPEMTAARALYEISGVMVAVAETPRAEVLGLKDENPTPEAELSPPGMGAGADPRLPGAGEARDPSAPPPLPLPPGTDPLFPDGPPGFRPPGPAQEPVPGADVDALREERARRLQEFRERRVNALQAGTPESPPRLEQFGNEARPGMGLPRGVPAVAPSMALPTGGQAPALPQGMGRPLPADPRARDFQAPEQPAPAPFGLPSPTVTPSEEPDFPPAATSLPSGSTREIAPEDRLLLELEVVTIDGSQVSIKGEANSIEAATLFEQKLRHHKCFQEVALEGTERITFERHRNWYSFRMSFKVDCRSEADAKGKTTPREDG